MTPVEFTQLIHKLLPDACFGQEKNGEVIVYKGHETIHTGWKIVQQSCYVCMKKID